MLFYIYIDGGDHETTLSYRVLLQHATMRIYESLKPPSRAEPDQNASMRARAREAEETPFSLARH